ncbi:MAG: RidA family protein [Cyclobacteriaceae bacterium]
MRRSFSVLSAVILLYLSFDLQAQPLDKNFINPGPGYTQVVVTEASSVKTIHVSGQVGEGKNLEEQLRAAFKNLEKQLKDAGATLSDIVKMNTYIVRYKESDLDTFRKVRGEILGDSNMPANTLVGVYSLFKDQYLVELEAVAIKSTN